MRSKSTLVTMFGLVLVAATAPAAGAARAVEQTVSADADARVDIELFSGSVTVTGWNRKSVEVTGAIETRGADLLLETSGHLVEVGVEWGDDEDLPGHATLTVRVPEGASVRVEGVNLTTEVRDVKGAVELEVVNGNATVSGAPASVDIESVNGLITIDAATDDVRVESVSGKIDIRGARGDIGAETVSGDITLAVEKLVEGDFSSVSGAIRLTGDLAGAAVLDVECHSGTVVLTLPAAVSARFSLETFTGSIESDFPGGRLTEEDFGLGKEMSLRTGDGDADVSITTFSGGIEIRKK